MNIIITIDIALFIITIATTVGYVTLISRILTGWEDSPDWKTPTNFKPKTKVSIIIAARNEEYNIVNCLKSIESNNYLKSLFEVILVDDSSSDNTAEKARSIKNDNLRILTSNKNIGKKAAITLGIEKAKGELIIVTDADSTVPPKWIETIVSYYEKSGARVIAGTIQYYIDKSLIQRFQYMDSINNMAVTANGINRKAYYMANGANLAYEKSLFNELGGFSNEDEIASGDDMYMIQSAAKLDPNSVRFLKSKDAIVYTQAESSISDLMNQRKRWATKTKNYTDKRVIKIQGFVFFFILLLLTNLVFTFWGSGLSLFTALFALFIKLSIDYLYLSKLQKYFKSKDALKSFFPASILFLVYILIAGWWALVPSEYNWKGRKVK